MSCIIDKGLSRGCRDNAGGMYTYYIANYPSGTTTSSEYLTKDGDGMVTGFTGTNTGLTEVEFYEFTPNKNSGNYNEEYQISLENGTRGYAQKVAGNFSKLSQEKQNLIDNLASGNFLVIIKDKNGSFFLMGENDAAVLGSGSASTGTALADLNGYVLELVAEEGRPAPQVESGSFNVL